MPYSREVTDKILARMAEGESLRQICRDDGMPSAPTVRRWVIENQDGLAERYARARDAQCMAWADEIIEIAEDGSNDWIERETRSGRIVKDVDREHVSRSNLRLEARKWLLSKLHPELFADRIQKQTLGADGKPIDPTKQTITHVDERVSLDDLLSEFTPKQAPKGDETQH